MPNIALKSVDGRRQTKKFLIGTTRGKKRGTLDVFARLEAAKLFFQDITKKIFVKLANVNVLSSDLLDGAGMKIKFERIMNINEFRRCNQ